MKKNILFCFCTLICFNLHAQLIIHGRVTDNFSHEEISGAQIWFEKENVYASSDSAGFFSVVLNEPVPVLASHISYEFISGIYYGDSLLISMKMKNNLFEEVVISDTRVDYFSPVTTTNLSGPELNKNNFGVDMPQLLEFTPSAVATSDAGNGIGYTGLRIRGSDATRINVTINGVPYNDAESQQTFWVDINDIAESTDDIQIQRGIGSSVNGISSFGGSVNINTNQLNEKPFASAFLAAGSFNLYKASASFGTGRMNEHWILEGRVSRITADGYIDRSFADLSSFTLTSAYLSEKYTSVLNIFSGKEKTYQSWGGVPKDSLQTNRTYNPYTYENQTDNYVQTHYQWHNNFFLNKNSNIRLSLNLTPGKGYYEQLEEDQAFADYGAENIINGGDTIFASDIITQKWLDNMYYGVYLQYENEISEKTDLHIGAATYQYTGSHFGKVIWAEYAAPYGINYEWYRNHAVKNDANIFAVMHHAPAEKLLLYADMQVRAVGYSFEGFDENASSVDQSVDLLFFNPKLGVTYMADRHHLISLSFSETGHEPNSDDYTGSSPLSRPSPEFLYDVELNHKLQQNGWQIQTTFFYMYYHDQLVLTGKINDVGAYTRTNIPVSYRRGVELAWAKSFFEKLSWNANLSLSENKIKNYTEFIDNWDSGEQLQKTYENTTIAFSPGIIAANSLQWTFYQKDDLRNGKSLTASATVQSKFVGRQYADNTTNIDRSIDPYVLNDIILNFSTKTKIFNELNLGISVQNALDEQYESNAWVYPYIFEGQELLENGYFPQAGRSLALLLRARF